MADVRWIKIVTDIFDDEKILLIESMPDADSIIVIWFKLLCLAGKQNNSGVFIMNGAIPFTDEMFATIFRRPLNTVRLALKTFEQYGMIEIVNGAVTIPKWEKHQKLDALEASRDATRKRVARYRSKQKLLTGGCNVTETFGNADRIDKSSLDKNSLDITTCEAEDDPENTQRYAIDNLAYLSPTAMQELASFLEDVPDDLVRYAIDLACEQNKRTWAYTKSILNRWIAEGIRTVGEAKAAADKFRAAQNKPSPQDKPAKRKDWDEMTEEERKKALASGPFGKWVD